MQFLRYRRIAYCMTVDCGNVAMWQWHRTEVIICARYRCVLIDITKPVCACVVSNTHTHTHNGSCPRQLCSNTNSEKVDAIHEKWGKMSENHHHEKIQ